MANVQKLDSASYLETTALVEILLGHHLHQGGVEVFGFQGDSDGHGFIGLQEADAEFGLFSSFQDGRNGQHVLPVDAGRLGVVSHVQITNLEFIIGGLTYGSAATWSKRVQLRRTQSDQVHI